MGMPQNDIPRTRNRANSNDLQTWRSYTAAGLSVIPIATDGTKSPAWQVLPKERKANNKRTTNATDVDKPKPTDDELAERWIAAQPLTVFARSTFYRYESGLWQIHPQPIAKREIKEILEAAKAEKIRPTNALLSSVYALAQYTVARRDTDFDASSDYLVCRNGHSIFRHARWGRMIPISTSQRASAMTMPPTQRHRHGSIILNGSMRSVGLMSLTFSKSSPASRSPQK